MSTSSGLKSAKRTMLTFSSGRPKVRGDDDGRIGWAMVAEESEGAFQLVAALQRARM